mmetsp:Transcript_66768/g.139401  ORF Transcript_66768/g.139401 Transcript_66768/m.139401 type:complete len:83 (-) Transcript_66768:196-444(-)
MIAAAEFACSPPSARHNYKVCSLTAGPQMGDNRAYKVCSLIGGKQKVSQRSKIARSRCLHEAIPSTNTHTHTHTQAAPGTVE